MLSHERALAWKGNSSLPERRWMSSMSKYTRECASRVDVEINNHKVQSSVGPTKTFFSSSEKRDSFPKSFSFGIHIDVSFTSAHKLQCISWWDCRLFVMNSSYFLCAILYEFLWIHSFKYTEQKIYYSINLNCLIEKDELLKKILLKFY